MCILNRIWKISCYFTNILFRAVKQNIFIVNQAVKIFNCESKLTIDENLFCSSFSNFSHKEKKNFNNFVWIFYCNILQWTVRDINYFHIFHLSITMHLFSGSSCVMLFLQMIIIDTLYWAIPWQNLDKNEKTSNLVKYNVPVNENLH